MANKVEFGISELHVGTFTDNGGTITMGSPMAVKGAVSCSLEEQGDNSTFFADNGPYYATYSTGTYEGDLEVALFTDAFKTQFLGFVTLADGGIAQIKNASRPNVYIAFQIEGDNSSRRVIFYNASLGNLTREYNTTEDSIEVATESLAVTVTGDNTTGITMASYFPDDAGYNTLFTNPPAPVLPTSGE